MYTSETDQAGISFTSFLDMTSLRSEMGAPTLLTFWAGTAATSLPQPSCPPAQSSTSSLSPITLTKVLGSHCVMRFSRLVSELHFPLFYYTLTFGVGWVYFEGSTKKNSPRHQEIMSLNSDNAAI